MHHMSLEGTRCAWGLALDTRVCCVRFDSGCVSAVTVVTTAASLEQCPRKGFYREIFINDQPFWLLNLKDSSCQCCCQGE